MYTAVPFDLEVDESCETGYGWNDKKRISMYLSSQIGNCEEIEIHEEKTVSKIERCYATFLICHDIAEIILPFMANNPFKFQKNFEISGNYFTAQSID